MEAPELPAGWEPWNVEPDRLVAVYRPDVFDGSTYPAAWIPTLYLVRGERDRRPGGGRVGTDWHLRLTLEPDVALATDSFPARDAAVDAAQDLAERFANGTIALREPYEDSPEEYLSRLEDLTGDA